MKWNITTVKPPAASNPLADQWIWRAWRESREKWFIGKFHPRSRPHLPVDLFQWPEEPFGLIARCSIVIVVRNAAHDDSVYNTDSLSRYARRHDQRQITP